MKNTLVGPLLAERILCIPRCDSCREHFTGFSLGGAVITILYFSPSLNPSACQLPPLVACVSRAGLLLQSGLEQSGVWGDGTGPCWPGKGSGFWPCGGQGGKHLMGDPSKLWGVWLRRQIYPCYTDLTFWKAFFSV